MRPGTPCFQIPKHRGAGSGTVREQGRSAGRAGGRLRCKRAFLGAAPGTPAPPLGWGRCPWRWSLTSASAPPAYPLGASLREEPGRDIPFRPSGSWRTSRSSGGALASATAFPGEIPWRCQPRLPLHLTHETPLLPSPAPSGIPPSSTNPLPCTSGSCQPAARGPMNRERSQVLSTIPVWPQPLAKVRAAWARAEIGALTASRKRTGTCHLLPGNLPASTSRSGLSLLAPGAQPVPRPRCSLPGLGRERGRRLSWAR